MIEAIRKLTEDMRGKMQLMVGRAILAATRDGGAIQTAQVQLLDEEIHDDAERIQEYGFSSVPLAGAEGVLVFVGGNRDHGLIIATDDRRYRKNAMAPGEVCLYTDEGDSVVLSRGRVIRVTAGAELSVTAPLVNVVASSKVRMVTPRLEVTGDIRDRCDATDGRTMAQMRSTYSAHTHRENNTNGDTNTPTQAV